MADENLMEKAIAEYDLLCSTLDEMGWRYEKDKSRLSVETIVQGEDIPIKYLIQIVPDLQLLRLYSHMPFIVPEDKRLEMSYILNYINSKLVDGSFDFDVNSGGMLFRITSSFIDSEIGNLIFTYIIHTTAVVVDEFNDKLFEYADGQITFEQLMEKI